MSNEYIIDRQTALRIIAKDWRCPMAAVMRTMRPSDSNHRYHDCCLRDGSKVIRTDKGQWHYRQY